MLSTFFFFFFYCEMCSFELLACLLCTSNILSYRMSPSLRRGQRLWQPRVGGAERWAEGVRKGPAQLEPVWG